MAYDDKTLKRDGSGITPVPQHFNPTINDYEPIYGRNNAGRVEIYGPDGNPISTDDSNKLAVRASEIETILNEIKSKDFATQTTAAAILAKLIAAPATEAKQTAIELILNSLDGKDYSTLAKQNEILVKLAALETKLSSDPATQTTLAAILAKIIDAPATEAKQDTIIGHVDGIEGALTALNDKDFATQTTLSQILAKIIAAPATEAKQDTLIGHVDGVESALASILEKLIAAPATEAKQDALAALIGEVQATPTANTLLARLKSLEDKIAAIDSVLDAIVDGSTPAVTQLSGSYVEIGGVSFAVSGGDTLRGKAVDRPDAVAAHAVIPYCYYFSIDTGVVEATDGTNWVVI